VIRAGENLSPREIEDFLYRHPKVQGVQVFGVPDARYGEEVCAWIQLRSGETATEEEIREFCRGRISHQKIPRYVRFVSEFPLTVTGKAQKFVMRERMKAELGVQEEQTA
jgi:fatty-acyl-CoA synthase